MLLGVLEYIFGVEVGSVGWDPPRAKGKDRDTTQFVLRFPGTSSTWYFFSGRVHVSLFLFLLTQTHRRETEHERHLLLQTNTQ